MTWRARAPRGGSLALARYWGSNNVNKKKQAEETDQRNKKQLTRLPAASRLCAGCPATASSRPWFHYESGAWNSHGQVCWRTPRKRLPQVQFISELLKTLLRTRNPQGRPRWPLDVTCPHCCCHYTHTHLSNDTYCYLQNPVATITAPMNNQRRHSLALLGLRVEDASRQGPCSAQYLHHCISLAWTPGPSQNQK